MILLSTAYLPPVDYLMACAREDLILIDAQETYQKQSYRNRCVIAQSQGPLPLIIPVVRPEGHRSNIQRIRIDHSAPWVRVHLGALRAAYAKTPFYPHYIDPIQEIIRARIPTLLQLNLAMIKVLLRAFRIQNRVDITRKIPECPHYDARNEFHPKKARAQCPEYYQPFADRLGFLPNLSAVDLLFNEGPDALKNLNQYQNNRGNTSIP